MEQEQILTTIEAVLEKYGARGKEIGVALSGGADSVCLLRGLCALREKMSLTLRAVHIHHHIRDAEADRDAEFCAVLCRKSDVPFQRIDVDVATYQKEHHVSVESAARQCRYDAFETIPADFVVTAHTASDNFETLLHRLIRGTSLRGLRGIPERRGRFLRPLLSVTREDVMAYLAAIGQDYVTDSTNFSDDYTRNKIRHKIVPEFRALNPAVERTGVHTLQSLARDDDYLQQQANIEWVARRDGAAVDFRDLHPALRFRILAMMLEENYCEVSADTLERLDALIAKGGVMEIQRNIRAVAEKETLALIAVQKDTPTPVPLQMGANQLYPGYVLSAKLVEDPAEIQRIHRETPKLCLDFDRCCGGLSLCPRNSSEKITLPGRQFPSTFKKYVQEYVPRYRRETLHCLRDHKGIVFAEFIGIDNRVKPDADTRRLLVLQIDET